MALDPASSRRVTAIALLSLGWACGSPDRTPEGATRLFLRAIANGDTIAVAAMLAPSSLSVLRQAAQAASAQAGGRRQFTPADMLATSLEQAGDGPSQVQAVRVQGSRAWVKLIGEHGKHDEVLELERIDGRIDGNWRIVLPDAEVAPASLPTQATQPPQPTGTEQQEP